jgi:hypothetical protein
MALTVPYLRPVDFPEAPAHGTVEAERAVYEALGYLRKSWNWSGSKLAKVLHLPPNTVNYWFSRKRVPVGAPPFDPTMQAVLHLLAIHRNLHSMFSEPANHMAWLTTPHPDFGTAPLEVMRESVEGLVVVRQYLDYVRGRGA